MSPRMITRPPTARPNSRSSRLPPSVRPATETATCRSGDRGGSTNHGLAEAPAAVLEAPVQYAGLGAASTEPDIGGDFAPLRTLGGLGEETNQLAGRPGVDWGDVLLAHYPAARDQYELTTTWIPVSAVHG